MNEWKELKVDNLPPDILTGDYEFDVIGDKFNALACLVRAKGSKLQYHYRRRQPEPPTHEEIMTKWWNLGGIWTRVVNYESREPYPYTLLAYANTVKKIFFISLESADIPPEAESC
jgi:hypothetical protein